MRCAAVRYSVLQRLFPATTPHRNWWMHEDVLLAVHSSLRLRSSTSRAASASHATIWFFRRRGPEMEVAEPVCGETVDLGEAEAVDYRGWAYSFLLHRLLRRVASYARSCCRIASGSRHAPWQNQKVTSNCAVIARTTHPCLQKRKDDHSAS